MAKYPIVGGTHDGEIWKLDSVANWICLESNQKTLPGYPENRDEFYELRDGKLRYIKPRST